MVNENLKAIVCGYGVRPLLHTDTEDSNNATISSDNHQGNADGGSSASNSSGCKRGLEKLDGNTLKELTRTLQAFLDRLVQDYMQEYRLNDYEGGGDPEWLATWLSWKAIYNNSRDWDEALAMQQPEISKIVHLAGEINKQEFGKLIACIPEGKLPLPKEEQDGNTKVMVKALRKFHIKQTIENQEGYYSADFCLEGKALEDYIAEAMDFLEDLNDEFLEQNCSHPEDDIPEWWDTMSDWVEIHDRLKDDVNKLLEESEMYVMLTVAAKVAPEKFEQVVGLIPEESEPSIERLLEDDIFTMVGDLRRFYLMGYGMPILD